MIRFLLVCITVIGFLILSIPILIVEWIIGKFKPYTKDISSLRLIQAVFRFILWLTGVEVTVIGEELVPKDEAVLYIGNHRSFFDILLTYTRCPAADRLYRKNRDGENTAAFKLDALSPLSLP